MLDKTGALTEGRPRVPMVEAGGEPDELRRLARVVAIERLIAAGVEGLSAAGAIAMYGLIYCLPCFALVILWRVRDAPIKRRIAPYIDRFRACRPRPAQPRRAAVYLIGAAVVAIVAFAM